MQDVQNVAGRPASPRSIRHSATWRPTIGGSLQLRQTAAPQLIKRGPDVLEPGEVNAVEASIAVTTDDDEASLAQDAEVLARRRLAEAHQSRQVAGAALHIRAKADELPSRGVREGDEGLVEGVGPRHRPTIYAIN
jgi:hypothetical protein